MVRLDSGGNWRQRQGVNMISPPVRDDNLMCPSFMYSGQIAISIADPNLPLLSSQAICSFVPSQIEFKPLKDTHPFGGLDTHLDSSRAEASLNMSQATIGVSQTAQSSSSAKSRPAPVSRKSVLSATSSSLLGRDSSKVPVEIVRDPDSTELSQKVEEELKLFDASKSQESRSMKPVGTTTAEAKATHRLPYDAVLFFHGLNGLELACERGNVPEGTCVLFNGASLLIEDNLDMLSGEQMLQAQSPLDRLVDYFLVYCALLHFIAFSTSDLIVHYSIYFITISTSPHMQAI